MRLGYVYLLAGATVIGTALPELPSVSLDVARDGLLVLEAGVPAKGAVAEDPHLRIRALRLFHDGQESAVGMSQGTAQRWSDEHTTTRGARGSAESIPSGDFAEPRRNARRGSAPSRRAAATRLAPNARFKTIGRARADAMET